MLTVKMEKMELMEKTEHQEKMELMEHLEPQEKKEMLESLELLDQRVSKVHLVNVKRLLKRTKQLGEYPLKEKMEKMVPQDLLEPMV